MHNIKNIIFYFLFLTNISCSNLSHFTVDQFLKSETFDKKYYLEPSLIELAISIEKYISSSFYLNVSLLSKTLPLRIENHMGYLKILPFSFIRTHETLSLKATIYSPFNQKVLNQLKDSDGFFLNCKLSWKKNKKFLLINMEASKEINFHQFNQDYSHLIQFLFPNHTGVSRFNKHDWVQFLQDQHFEGYEGELPDLKPSKKYKFEKSLN
ncbi:MAG: hypothetical protein COB02_02695 [Candidatus Cloacimonadota bacterium]|nr:MAG: hypothetical protein COB02_02695 [Candidatus Cloacimonadota bacterium]